MFMVGPMGYDGAVTQGGRRLHFRQLFDPQASAFTYLLGCSDTRQAMLIDPVLETAERDLALLTGLGLTLTCTVETHIHADHVTGAEWLRDRTGARSGVPETSDASDYDFLVREGEPIRVGRLALQPLHTPGHTADSFCYLLAEAGSARVFTGDTLLIDGCGRTDFQNGDAAALYRSVQDKLFTLPGETLVYPGYDYQGRRVSSIGQEMGRNPRLGGGEGMDEFVAFMASLKLPNPKMMDVAVPANLAGGIID
jgi:glyoxylase-like metal-dependent hydrolase (beta-lactamase superfamily II)